MNFADQTFSGEIVASLRLSGPVGGRTKRTFDIVVSLFAIIALLPLFAGCAIAIWASSPGPVLFMHRRIGYRGRSFGCLKFRTMVVDAEQRLQDHLASNPEARREWLATHKLRNDPRIIPFGRFMRKSSLDELPQLFNVLRGEMSMVGPRPIVEEEVGKYEHEFSIYVGSRPGMTGLWQIRGRNKTTYAERVAYDTTYIRTWSLLNDLKILVATIRHVVDTDGAY